MRRACAGERAELEAVEGRRSLRPGSAWEEATPTGGEVELGGPGGEVELRPERGAQSSLARTAALGPPFRYGLGLSARTPAAAAGSGPPWRFELALGSSVPAG